jgi:hypothetical protein
VSDTARERAPEDHVRDALRRLNPTFHESDISWPSLDAILAEREALRTELHFSETMHQADLDERVKIEKDCRALRERVAAAERRLKVLDSPHLKDVLASLLPGVGDGPEVAEAAIRVVRLAMDMAQAGHEAGVAALAGVPVAPKEK